jgi:hypothetical protein
MRTSLAFAATLAGLLAPADRAFAQQPGQLRIAMHLADSRSGVTYHAIKKLLTITAEAGFPVYRAVRCAATAGRRPFRAGSHRQE